MGRQIHVDGLLNSEDYGKPYLPYKKNDVHWYCDILLYLNLISRKLCKQGTKLILPPTDIDVSTHFTSTAATKGLLLGSYNVTAVNE